MPVSGTSWNLLLDFPKSMGPPMPPPIGEPGPPCPPERRNRRKSPANATRGNNKLPNKPTKFPCCSPSETEMSTPFLAKISTSSGSLGRVTVALLPSTAVNCREQAFDQECQEAILVFVYQRLSAAICAIRTMHTYIVGSSSGHLKFLGTFSIAVWLDSIFSTSSTPQS